MSTKAKEAIRILRSLGYTHVGGVRWVVPPAPCQCEPGQCVRSARDCAGWVRRSNGVEVGK
jgi:hypothetical protein